MSPHADPILRRLPAPVVRPPPEPARGQRPRWMVAALVVGGAGLAQLTGTLPFSLGPGDGYDPSWGPPPPSGDVLGVSWWKPPLMFTLGDPKTSGLGRWTGDFDATPVATFDFDGDGVKEVVAHSNDTHVYVFSAKTGRVLADLTTSYPPAWHIERILNGVAAGKLQPNDPGSVVVGNHAAYVAVFQYVPAQSSADHFTFKKMWERRLTDYHASPAMDANPVLADLDGDGALEIVAQTEEQGLYALRADGKTMWSLSWGGGNAAPLVADLDGDKQPEVVFGSDGGRLSVLNGKTGNALWAFDVRSLGIDPGAIPVSPVAADLDGDGEKELIFTARDAHAEKPSEFLENHVAILAVRRGADYKSELVWMQQPAWAMPLSYTRPAVADTDGDGKPEVCGMDWNTMGHYPGNFERLGPANAFCLNGQTGQVRWHRELDTWWSNKEVALGDFDGDGKMELLANGPRDGYDGLWRLDAATGKPEAFLPSWPYKVERGPAIVDLRGDGTMQLVLPVIPGNSAGRQGGLEVFDLGAKWVAPWPGYDLP
jgi:outer membrane protein assembly factor BamB